MILSGRCGENKPAQGSQKLSNIANVVASSSRLEYFNCVNAVRSTISQKFERRAYRRWLRTE